MSWRSVFLDADVERHPCPVGFITELELDAAAREDLAVTRDEWAGYRGKCGGCGGPVGPELPGGSCLWRRVAAFHPAVKPFGPWHPDCRDIDRDALAVAA